MGTPIEIESWKDKVDAILYAWMPGLASGRPIAKVLTGEANPSGKLPATLPINVTGYYNDDPTKPYTPGLENFGSKTGITLKEGIFVGYRYYDTFGVPVSYEFGYGKNYSTFGYSNLKLSASQFAGKDSKLDVSVDVKNTSDIPGKEVVQLYVGAPGKSMQKPVKELKGFAKTNELNSDTFQTLNFTLDARSLASYDTARAAWVVEPGQYKVYAAASSKDIRLVADFTVPAEIIAEQVNKVLAAPAIDEFQSPLYTPSVPDPGHSGGGNNNKKEEPVNQNANSKVTLDATQKGSGIFEASVPEASIKTAIENTKGGTVQLKVQAAEGAKEVTVNIPASQIGSAADNQVKGIQLDTGIATVTIPTDLLKDNIGAASSNVQLSVSKVDASTLSEEVQKQIGSSTVYDFNLNVDGKKITDFNGKDVNVAVKYTLKAGEDPQNVVVYYISDSGKLEVVTNGKYNTTTGMVEFKPPHFSKYVIAYKISFNDIGGVPWAKESIKELAAKGIISGMGGNAFKPNDKVTRAQFIKMLMQAFGLADKNAKCTFTDVQEGAWYYSSIAAAEELGIVKGKADGTFGINDEISRQDMAVMSYRAAQSAKISLSGSVGATEFTDKSDISSYAVDAVSAMQGAGIINGLGDGKFAPAGQSTRAQAAAVIYRLFNLMN